MRRSLDDGEDQGAEVPTVVGDPGGVPHKVVDRGLSRSLPDNTVDIATWLDARGPGRRGDLTPKRSSTQMSRRGSQE
jgi:hypothetical protein